MREDQGDQASSADADAGSSEVAALYASASRIFARYSEQWDTSKQILRTELELTLKSLWLALVFIIIFFSVMVVTWLGVNVLLAYALLMIPTPVWGVALAISVFNLLTILVLTRTILGLFREVGFGRALAIFRSVQAESKVSSDTPMPTQTGGL